jgi:hypothetical protein
MNWFTKILGAIPLIGGVVAAIEKIHGDAVSGASKKQLALEALGLATAGAEAVLPGDKLLVDSASALVSQAIDLTVSLFNRLGWPHQPVPIVAPVAPAAPVTPSPRAK